LNLCPSTVDPAAARQWLEQWAPDTIEGLVLKPVTGSYRPGRRSARSGWRKWRLRETREAVVGAVTGPVARPTSALLGRWDAAGRLRYLGRTTTLTPSESRQMAAAIIPASTEHPWEGRRFAASWGSHDSLEVELVEPRAVAEISVDASRGAGGGWRHSVRMTRLRPDLAPQNLPLFGDEA